MSFTSSILLVSLALFAGMLAVLEFGWRRGRRRPDGEPDKARAGLAAAEGVLFALMGLLIAFSFSGAASRFEDRRILVVEECNAIGSAWRLLDLFSEPARSESQATLLAYLDERLEAYASLPDLEAAFARLDRAVELERALWDLAVAEAEGGSAATRLALPALNAAFDVASERTLSAQRHPPWIVFALLFVLAIACALMAGMAMGPSSRRPIGHMLAFALVVSFVFFVILDLEYPRLGSIRIDASDQALIELRTGLAGSLPATR